jgi:hypothetical protein
MITNEEVKAKFRAFGKAKGEEAFMAMKAYVWNNMGRKTHLSDVEAENIWEKNINLALAAFDYSEKYKHSSSFDFLKKMPDTGEEIPHDLIIVAAEAFHEGFKEGTSRPEYYADWERIARYWGRTFAKGLIDNIIEMADEEDALTPSYFYKESRNIDLLYQMLDAAESEAWYENPVGVMNGNRDWGDLRYVFSEDLAERYQKVYDDAYIDTALIAMEPYAHEPGLNIGDR